MTRGKEMINIVTNSQMRANEGNTIKIGSLIYAWLRQLNGAGNYTIDSLSLETIKNYKKLKVGAKPTGYSLFQPERLNPETPEKAKR